MRWVFCLFQFQTDLLLCGGGGGGALIKWAIIPNDNEQ